MRFHRTELLIGPEGLERLVASHVVVIGLGGVGAHAAEALARAGVGSLVLVDPDRVCTSNINRQVHALSETVGRLKAEIMAERLLGINPEARVLALSQPYDADSSEGILSGRIDYVVDAIDRMSSKLHLILTCSERSLRLICSAGAAARMDPTRVRVADISRTHTCPMARELRRLLRRRGIRSGVEVVFSDEPPIPPRQDVEDRCGEACDCANGPARRQAVDPRRPVQGSVSFVTSVFGLVMASVVVRRLLGFNEVA